MRGIRSAAHGIALFKVISTFCFPLFHFQFEPPHVGCHKF